jgi:hypothetical protein
MRDTTARSDNRSLRGLAADDGEDVIGWARRARFSGESAAQSGRAD